MSKARPCELTRRARTVWHLLLVVEFKYDIYATRAFLLVFFCTHSRFRFSFSSLLPPCRISVLGKTDAQCLMFAWTLSFSRCFAGLFACSLFESYVPYKAPVAISCPSHFISIALLSILPLPHFPPFRAACTQGAMGSLRISFLLFPLSLHGR